MKAYEELNKTKEDYENICVNFKELNSEALVQVTGADSGKSSETSKGMKHVIKYIIIWLLPVALLLACGYFFFQAVLIYFIGEGKFERLEGFTYLIYGVAYTVFLAVAVIIAIIITICVKKKAQANDKPMANQ